MKLAKLNEIEQRFCVNCISSFVQYGLGYDCNNCHIRATLESIPTVEAITIEDCAESMTKAIVTAVNTAIPVEQVARIVAKVTGMPPCAFETVPWSDERLEHCSEHCGVDDSDVLCWESAIKEGWLDE